MKGEMSRGIELEETFEECKLSESKYAAVSCEGMRSPVYFSWVESIFSIHCESDFSTKYYYTPYELQMT